MRHSLQRVLILTIAVIATAIPLASSAYDVRYWVWQRDDPLDEQELAELEAQKIDTIYWQAGELENTRETWHWKARFNFPSSNTAHIRFVPVVRLVSKEQQPFSDGSITAHPLRYLQRYLSDQLHFKIPAPPPAESVATN